MPIHISTASRSIHHRTKKGSARDVYAGRAGDGLRRRSLAAIPPIEDMGVVKRSVLEVNETCATALGEAEA